MHRVIALTGSLAALAGAGLEARGASGGGRLVINELLASNSSTNLDDDGDSSDWIELHNPGAEEADLAGLALSDEPSNPGKWKLPAVRVPPGGYFLVWASGKDRHRPPLPALGRAGMEVPFERAFIRAGEVWRYLLADPLSKGPPDGWTEPAFDDSSFAEGPSGFGYADDDDATVLPEGTTAVFLRRGFRVEDPLRVGQLVLRIDYDDGFVAYLNGARVAAVNSPVEHPDFAAIATDKHEPGRAERFDLTPHLARLRPGENLLAIAGLNDSPSTDMTLIPELGTFPLIPHTSFRLDPRGGELLLSAPGGAVVDRVTFARQAPDCSFGRSPDGRGDLVHFVTPTPGSENRFRAHREPPRAKLGFVPRPGAHPRPVEARISCESSAEGLQVHYTTDGTAPGPESAVASGPVPIERSTVIRAAGFLGGERATPVVSASYRIGPAPPLPVLSISMDPQEFTETHLNQNARGRAFEKRAYLEVIGPGGEVKAATGVGFRLHGGYGRRGGLETKKSYRLYFRGFYGDPRLSSGVIPLAPPEGLDTVVLRAGFNDRVGAHHPAAAFVRDQLARDLHRDMGALAAGGCWCLLYVNMEPKGLYNATERLDEEFLSAHLGAGEWDIVKTGNEVVSGTRDDWDALRRYVVENDLSREEHYRELGRRLDLENFTGYVILNLWAQNEDWPQNNWVAARRRQPLPSAQDRQPARSAPPSPTSETAPPGSRWIFLAWDVEFGFGLMPSGYRAESFRACFSRRSPIRDLLGGLLTSAEYREYFKREARRHLEGALRPENVQKHVARHRDAIAPAIAEELSRFAPGFPPEQWKRNVEALNTFAARRGEHFLRRVEAALDPEVAVDPGRDSPVLLSAGGRAARIVVRGEEGRFEELWQEPASGKWRRGRLGPDAGAPRAAGRPSVYAAGAGKALGLVYRGEDGHLHELSLALPETGSGPSRVLGQSDLTDAGRAPAAAGDPEALFWEAGGGPHLVYRGRGGQAHELRLEDGAWRHHCITLSASSPRIAGEPFLYARADDRSLNAVYLGEDGHIHQLWIGARKPAPGKPRVWRHQDLTGAQPGAQPGAGRAPAPARGGGSEPAIVRRPDGQLCTIVSSPRWQLAPFAAALGAPPSAGEARSFVLAGSRTRQVVYRDHEGGIHELLFKGTWRRLEAAAEGAPPAAGDPVGWIEDGGTRHVAYRSGDGRLHLLTFDAGLWSHQDLTAAAAGSAGPSKP